MTLKLGTFRFSSAESAYQCLKQPKLSRSKVAVFQLTTPYTAREYGRQIPLREDWDEVKDDVMRQVLAAKFSDSDLRAYLVTTGERELLHWAPWDTYWGMGRDGNGENRLGTLLMELRANISV